MSVEIRIVMHKKLFELLQKKAKDMNLELNDLIILALEKILSE